MGYKSQSGRSESGRTTSVTPCRPMGHDGIRCRPKLCHKERTNRVPSSEVGVTLDEKGSGLTILF
ncbi:hypothetical protein WG66_001301 [Moniliophthora roreri]|nr:hypothetical protein WG66_001301 [Moniliophthora roreri]